MSHLLILGLHNLEDVINSLKKSNVKIILSGVNSSVLKTIKEYQLVSLIDESNIFDSFKGAIQHSKNILKKE